MKKILLFALATIALSGLAHAQIEKGNVMLGGNVNFSSNKSESNSPPNNKTKTTSYGINPAVGVAIKPNTIIGIQLGYGHGKSSSEPNSGDQENLNYGAEVFLRKYLTLGKGFFLFAQPGVYFNKSTLEYSHVNSEQTIKNWNTGVSLYPGISYAVNKRFHLEVGMGNLANLSYGQSENETKLLPSGQIHSKSEGNGFSFSSSLSNYSVITIGFRFFLAGKG